MELQNMTQEERLLAYFGEHQTITPMEAWTRLGIYRLSDVVFKLRNAGHNIATERVEVKNKFKETCRVARYQFMRVAA